MQPFVLDANVVISFLLQEESAYADGVFQKHLARGARAYVPSLWHLEIRNVLFLKERAKKLAVGEAHQALASLGSLMIVTDAHTTAASTLMHLERLMLHHGLTSYDASYLELAYRLDVPIATQDKEILAAAKSLKVGIL
ncbi:MAG: type II toxin-antitoxin system VapC family toxin [Chthoniobacterales bacterium]|nr:type II toxin-antitoxin system VapC family toxin [Chthoniobacterales bacterium]